MTDRVPEPPEGLSEASLDHWLRRRDELAERGPVTVAFPAEPIGEVSLGRLGGDQRELVPAAGTIEIPTYATASLTVTRSLTVAEVGQITTSDPDAFFMATVEGADDTTVLQLAPFTGLTRLFISGDAFTGKGLVALASLPNVHHLRLDCHCDAGTYGALEQSRLALLDHRGPLTADGLSAILSIPTLSRAMLHDVQPFALPPLPRPENLSTLMVTGDLGVDWLASLASQICPPVTQIVATRDDETELDRAITMQLQLWFPDVQFGNEWLAPAALRKVATKRGIELVEELPADLLVRSAEVD